MYIDSHTVAFAWPLFSLIVAGIAQGKGHSGLLWFLLTLFLGPLALLILLFCENRRW